MREVYRGPKLQNSLAKITMKKGAINEKAVTEGRTKPSVANMLARYIRVQEFSSNVALYLANIPRTSHFHLS